LRARSVIEVAAAALVDAGGRVLLAQRPPGKHLAGMWEFPGGKCEQGESVEDALRRELDEELGVRAQAFSPLIAFPWRYADKTIHLHAMRVETWRGEPVPREGQGLRWQRPRDIDPGELAPADRPVLTALRLPTHYAITPPDADPRRLPAMVEAALARGLRLLQLRLPSCDAETLHGLAADLATRCRAAEAALLVNGHAGIARELGIGLHLPAAQLMRLAQRPLPPTQWLSASCHDGSELEHAARIGVDFVTLSPVAHTGSHPQAAPLDWPRFAALVAPVPLPVYALGGLAPDDLAAARLAGAQGIAAIRAFWPGGAAGNMRE
jgi:8-oxo-dGTP diphosphatase